MAELKGAMLKGAMSLLSERYGTEAVKTAIEALSPEDRALLPPVIFDSNWYPYDVWRAFRRVSRRLATGRGDPDLPFGIGKAIAQYTFTGVYRSLLVKDPRKMVEKFAWIHDFFYRDTAKLETVIVSESSCLVRYHYEPGIALRRSSCASTLGFWVRTLELAGGRRVKASHDKCMLDGQAYCEYSVEWQV